MRRLSFIIATLIVVALVLVGIHFFRYRFVRQNSDLVRLVPPGDLNLIYADLGSLRQAQLLGLLANIKVATDKEYSDFIRETGFDYTRDLDAIAIGADGSRTFLIGRGRFDWDKLKQFAIGHQGKCEGAGCRVPGSTPGRWVTLITVQPDVLAVAVGPSTTGADDVRPPGRRLEEEIPASPVWAKLSHALLTRPGLLPMPIQIFAISLQAADAVTLSATADHLQLKASFPNAAAADTARQQLQIQTRLVTAALKQESSDRASFAGMVTAGSFQVIGNDLSGIWPVHPELLRALR